MLAHSLISVIKNKLTTKFNDPILCEQYAGWLLQWVTQRSELDLITNEKVEWTDTHQKKLDDALNKLINQDMPLAYLFGSIPFAGLDILVEPPILIPRAETEEWASNLIDTLCSVKNKPLTILDLCTGSGCIALALAEALPHAKVYGTDSNEKALKLAQKNAKHNQISNVIFLHSNLFDAIPKHITFDLIVANPPYIPEKQWSGLEPSVKNWEDKSALIAPDEGMALIKEIITQTPPYLKFNETLKTMNVPQLIIEIDATQGTTLSTYLENHGYTHVMITKDLEGKDRVISGRVDHVATATHS